MLQHLSGLCLVNFATFKYKALCMKRYRDVRLNSTMPEPEVKVEDIAEELTEDEEIKDDEMITMDEELPEDEEFDVEESDEEEAAEDEAADQASDDAEDNE